MRAFEVPLLALLVARRRVGPVRMPLATPGTRPVLKGSEAPAVFYQVTRVRPRSTTGPTVDGAALALLLAAHPPPQPDLPTMSPRPIIIDCDPGHDDALALLLALASLDELEVIAVTAVAGNGAGAHREERAQSGRAGRPARSARTAAVTDRWSAPGDRRVRARRHRSRRRQLPEPGMAPAPAHAVDAIIEILRATWGRSRSARSAR